MRAEVRQVRFLLVGTGNVGRRFLELLPATRERLGTRLGLALVAAGVADSSGAALCPDGLDPQQVVELKGQGLGVAAYPRWGRPGMTALQMAQEAGADLLLDASPGNLQTGQPGLACVEAALDRLAELYASAEHSRAMTPQATLCIQKASMSTLGEIFLNWVTTSIPKARTLSWLMPTMETAWERESIWEG